MYFIERTVGKCRGEVDSRGTQTGKWLKRASTPPLERVTITPDSATVSLCRGTLIEQKTLNEFRIALSMSM